MDIDLGNSPALEANAPDADFHPDPGLTSPAPVMVEAPVTRAEIEDACRGLTNQISYLGDVLGELERRLARLEYVVKNRTGEYLP